MTLGKFFKLMQKNIYWIHSKRMPWKTYYVQVSQCACPCGQQGLGKDWPITRNFSKSSQAVLNCWNRKSSLGRLPGRGRTFCTELTKDREQSGEIWNMQMRKLFSTGKALSASSSVRGDGLDGGHRRPALQNGPALRASHLSWPKLWEKLLF